MYKWPLDKMVFNITEVSDNFKSKWEGDIIPYQLLQNTQETGVVENWNPFTLLMWMQNDKDSITTI